MSTSYYYILSLLISCQLPTASSWLCLGFLLAVVYLGLIPVAVVFADGCCLERGASLKGAVELGLVQPGGCWTMAEGGLVGLAGFKVSLSFFPCLLCVQCDGFFVDMPACSNIGQIHFTNKYCIWKVQNLLTWSNSFTWCKHMSQHYLNILFASSLLFLVYLPSSWYSEYLKFVLLTYRLLSISVCATRMWFWWLDLLPCLLEGKAAVRGKQSSWRGKQEAGVLAGQGAAETWIWEKALCQKFHQGIVKYQSQHVLYWF